MSNFLQALRIALRALRINKMRSFLTMLGIIIGIAAVIAMMAVGSGASYVISQQIASIGSNILLVLPGSMTSGGLRSGSGGVQTLKASDAKAMTNECPSVELAAPVVRSSGQIVYGNQNWSTLLMGATPELFVAREWPVINGRSITDSDNDGAAKVCVIGSTIVQNLSGLKIPLGKMIRIKKVPFVVVGCWNPRGSRPRAPIRMM